MSARATPPPWDPSSVPGCGKSTAPTSEMEQTSVAYGSYHRHGSSHPPSKYISSIHHAAAASTCSKVAMGYFRNLAKASNFAQAVSYDVKRPLVMVLSSKKVRVCMSFGEVAWELCGEPPQHCPVLLLTLAVLVQTFSLRLRRVAERIFPAACPADRAGRMLPLAVAMSCETCVPLQH